MTVTEIMNERKLVEGDPVFHLVCPLPETDADQVLKRRANAGRAPNSAQSNTSPSQPIINGQPTAQNNLSWEQWAAMYQQNAASQQYQQYLAAYYQQWTQYQMHYHASMAAYGAVPLQQFSINSNADAAAQVQMNNVPMVAAANQRNVAHANRVAGFGGDRIDVLEIFYRLFKLVLLFSAVLLYSSFERFLLVLSGALFIYFIQLRRHQLRNREAAAAAAASLAQAAPAANDDPPQQFAAVNNNNAGENEELENIAPTEQQVAAPSQVYVFVATCYSFITSFFASLVPDHPVPVDIN